MGVRLGFIPNLRGLILLTLLFSVLAAGPALGQGAGSVKFGEQNKPPAPVAAASQIDVQVTHFGVGDRARPGDWAGIQLSLVNRGTNFPNVLARLELVDSDGDIAQYSAAITANPGAKQSLWMYARLPYDIGDRQLAFSVYEAIEGSPGSGVTGIRAGQMLGRTVYAPRRVADRFSTGIGLVGRSQMGLHLYNLHDPNSPFLPLGHGLSELLPGLAPGDLPDRWLGYAPMETLVWGASGAEGEPTDLTEPQASALREWVRRGGHLVVVLPSVGQTWLGANNPLADIMPRVKAVREEGVNLDRYRKLITGRIGALPSNVVIHTFEPIAGAAAGEADAIMAGPDGRAIVCRRLAGTGAVTVIGVDLAGRVLGALDAVQPDIFWHRVLGKRGTLWTANEQAAASRSNNPPPPRVAGVIDADIANEIDQKGASAIGVLLAFLVFVAYWIVAAPAVYFVLRQKGHSQHAWVGFVAMVALFTALSWGGATLIKPRRYEVRHVTLADYVYGQNVLRARLWGSALLPTYGDVKVAVGNADDTRFNNAISAWEPPSEGATSTNLYPDSRGYAVDARNPSSATFPARSTVKSIMAEWAGAGGDKWKMPLPVKAKDAPADAAPVVAFRKLEIPVEGRRFAAEGVLKNESAYSIENVSVLFVGAQGPPPSASSGAVPEGLRAAMPFSIIGAKLQGPWASGASIDLAPLAVAAQSTRNPEGDFESGLRTLAGTVRNTGFSGGMAMGDFAVKGFEDRMLAAALYGILPPPPRSTTQGSEPAFLRLATQGWDLSRNFTQPCIVVIGFVRDAPSPVPLSADGDPLPTTGLTMIRWVYPLPAVPPPLDQPLPAN